MYKFPELGSTQKLTLRTKSSKNDLQISKNEAEMLNETNQISLARVNYRSYVTDGHNQKKDLRLTQMFSTDAQQIVKLQTQVQFMQRQLKQQMSSQSFIKKLSNDQCSNCDRNKLTYEEALERAKEQQKYIKDYIKEIEQLKLINRNFQGKLHTTSMELADTKKTKLNLSDNNNKQTNFHVDNISKIRNSQVYFQYESSPELIQFSVIDDSSKNQEINHTARFKSVIQELNIKNEELEKHISLINKQMSNVLKNSSLESQMNDQLKMELQELEQNFKRQQDMSNQLSKNLEQAEEKIKKYQQNGPSVLPDSIHLLKKTIDLNVTSGVDLGKLLRLETQVKLLERDKSALQTQIKDQDIKIMNQAREKNIENQLIKIEALEIELYLSLRCTKCKDLLKDPLTCIPCGHTYCLKCHKGFKLSCEICDASSNTEALYRNIQFDELIKIYYIIQSTKQFIKNCLLSM